MRRDPRRLGRLIASEMSLSIRYEPREDAVVLRSAWGRYRFTVHLSTWNLLQHEFPWVAYQYAVEDMAWKTALMVLEETK